ncbi:hypothetical protein INT45_000894 [Circinella minor]|uniref:Uncharacterized protein n=1 Tax=Circinella minor TaxID=1195481 RepID=A0A8H7RKV7_9FUNG|nr:hypothetical protein INT45_000894 [Circinella minor]
MGLFLYKELLTIQQSTALIELATQIWKGCLNTNTKIQLMYIASQFNPADPPSQQQHQQLEWSISQTFFNHLNHLWGPHHLDCFATHLNNKIPQFMSWQPNPQAVATNSLQQTWFP